MIICGLDHYSIDQKKEIVYMKNSAVLSNFDLDPNQTMSVLNYL